MFERFEIRKIYLRAIAGASHMGGDVLSLSTNSSKAKGKVK